MVSKLKNAPTKQKFNLLFFGLFFVLLSFGFSYIGYFTQSASAAIAPSIITYQGKLLYNSVAVTTTQSIKIILYDNLTGGSALYSASGTTSSPQAINVTPNNGIFTIDLGGSGTNSLSPTLFRDNAGVYLEVVVGSETLSPRKRIAASPYAFNSRYLDGVGTATVSSSQYIPMSDGSGNFTFNSTTFENGIVVRGGSVTTTITNNIIEFSATGTLKGAPTDVAGNAALVVDSVSALNGASLLSIRNGGVEKVIVDSDGSIQLPSNGGMSNWWNVTTGYFKVGGYMSAIKFFDYNNTDYFLDPSATTSLLVAGKIGLNTTTPGALLHAVTTTEQLRLGYDGSNYTQFAVSTSGTMTMTANTAAGAVNGFVLNVPNFTASQQNVGKYLFSVRASNNMPEFSVEADGSVRASGTLYAANANVGTPGNPGDLAERVDIAIDDAVEAGDVMMVDADSDDRYRRVNEPYSTKVAGVISTNPTIVVGNGKTDFTAMMAMIGRVPVKVSAENGPIQRGDLLVSASMPGYAMRYDAAKDNRQRMVGVIGVALESFSFAVGTGKIITLVRTGWVNSGDVVMAELQNDINQLASEMGVSLRNNSTILRVSQNSAGQLGYNGGDLDLQGNGILNVEKIIGKNNKWMIDESGNLIGNLETSRGTKSMYALWSPSLEFVFSSSSQLIGGEARIEFDEVTKEIIDADKPLKISVTLTSGEAQGIYVSEKNKGGFAVKELNNGASNASFDWMAVAKRKEEAPFLPSSENERMTNEQQVVEPAESASLSAPLGIEQLVPSSTEQVPAELISIPMENVGALAATSSESVLEVAMPQEVEG